MHFTAKDILALLLHKLKSCTAIIAGRREDLRIHKLESLRDISVPTMKEICMEVMFYKVCKPPYK